MAYTRRTYEEVADTFTRAAKSPDIALLGVLPVSNKVTVGINRQGIWLWHIDASKPLSLKIFPSNCPIGFFEWSWIREIQISYSLKAASVYFYDIDAMLDSVVIESSRKQVRKYLHGKGEDRHLRFPLTTDSQYAVFNSAGARHYANVYKVE